MNLKDLQQKWHDHPDYHRSIHEMFCNNVDCDDVLGTHRKYIRETVYGFGEDSFWWLWKLLLNELPKDPALLEIGVYKGATLSVWKLLRPDAHVFGITPLDNSGDMPDEDYGLMIKELHDKFNQHQPYIFHGRSDNPKIIEASTSFLYDVVYVDGDHSYDGAMHDLVTYAPCVKKGGYLVVDDACNDLKMDFGVFQGIQEVTDATLDYINQTDIKWEFITNVVHIRIYQRV